VKRLARVLGVLLVLGVPGYWWFLLESGTPSQTFHLELHELRRLSETMAGDRPHFLRVEHVSGFEFPEVAVVAGRGWSMTKMPVYAYQLEWADGGTAMIDTAMDEKVAKGEYASFFDQKAFERVQAGISEAQWVVVTHEHYDHLGGAAVHPKLDALAGGVVRLTKEQLSSEKARKPLVFTPEQLQKLPTLELDKTKVIAPGVVVIRSAGHTPGMQMVYVRRDDDEEYLFVSDVSWHQDNWQEVRERARLVTALFLGEDRDAVLAQLKAIKAAAEGNPKLHVVPGHDGVVMAQLLESGALVSGFKAP